MTPDTPHTPDTPDIDAPSLLDPADWASFREQAHAALDVALDHVRERPTQGVWQELPELAKRTDAPLPVAGAPLPELVAELQERVLPYTLGNIHPRFWGWVNGTGTASGIVAQMLTASINANMGGRDHAPIYLERQVLGWMQSLFGLPAGSSGMICSGTSTATLLGLAIARQRATAGEVRRGGNAVMPGLRVYTSAQAHVSVDKALEMMGLGSQALCSVPVAADFSMDVDALARCVAEDVAAGLQPFAVVSSVGSVNTGAIDDLPAINALCADYGLWHHVDGAFGALCMLSEVLRPRLAGIEAADSIAFDFHKWMHVGYSVGCLLVADGELHRQTFQTSHAYLQGERQGIAGGTPWPNDFGLELSRGFAALGVWFQLREMGIEKLGRAIHRNCLQAGKLGEAVAVSEHLELLAPVSLNIVCFRYRAAGLTAPVLDQLNRRIVVELQCRGIAAPSFTVINGSAAIRVAITNHRTRWRDLQALLDACEALGSEFLAAS
ncbi:pyridoxal phosphate-dependent decarboxylase family protein [Parahaliea aestuarii]|uniref:Cytochrome D ubiquinol oxidase subunit I n=1 Tax=Parahaliea aestuarii TaxID=1852021 RepID=A0A5C8ZVW1_9GAMM|nr:pyridoxal-dependent decarboxylase [Parahaliea aestuarii]TXS91690.1 cytochrome D ubiquinol oxidase subunit I [Parahaliea aestuarii]